MDFRVDTGFQEKLDWMNRFVREEVEPLDLLFPGSGAPYDTKNTRARALVKPLQAQVKQHGLWACHLPPELGGKGYGQLKLALMNEIIGRFSWAPTVFGCAAPDTGNAEILAMFGTGEQKARFLQPLLDGEIVSCFSMSEPQAGADPKEFTCRAWRESDAWLIEGEKWYSSNARYASFFIIMAVTEPEAAPHSRMSMFIVPAEAAGIVIKRNVAGMNDTEEEGTHAHLQYNRVRVPLDAMLGKPGEAFKVAQARLGGGRIHHAMRTVGLCSRALDMMLERAVSRRTQGRMLGDHQFVQGMIADSAIELEQFRLLVLKTAWLIDTEPHGAARTHIGMCKVALAKVYHDIAQRAVHLHGALGTSRETPLAKMWMGAPMLAVADGPTEVHKVQIAKALMRDTKPASGVFPTEYLPAKREAVLTRYADLLREPPRREPK
jgi:acyl-CoA dehydrogenase